MVDPTGVEDSSLEAQESIDGRDQKPLRIAKKRFSATKVGLKNAAQSVGSFVGDQVADAKNKVLEIKEKEKEPEPYEIAVAEYNVAYALMSDKGILLMLDRQRTTDLISLVEHLINSIANTPKTFTADIATISTQKAQFLESEEYARKDLAAAKISAASAGAGVAAAGAVATIAPTAAMWIATTFGTASTGTAISTLSGAAATKAALAWLGGGAIVAGGGGTAAGTALLAMAGPIGWGIAGATLLTSIVLFSKKKLDNREEKEKALTSLKENTAQVKQFDAQINDLLAETILLREQVLNQYQEAVTLFGADFSAMDKKEQTRLGALVNNTLASTAQLAKRVTNIDDELYV